MIFINYRSQNCGFPFWLKFICNPKINIHGLSQTCTKGQKIRVIYGASRAEVKQGYALPSCFKSPPETKCFLPIYLVPHFLHFSAIYQRICYLKWPQRVTLKCCLLFLSTRRLWCALWRRHKWQDTFRQELCYLSSVLVNQ